jgi:hypothetical protein
MVLHVIGISQAWLSFEFLMKSTWAFRCRWRSDFVLGFHPLFSLDIVLIPINVRGFVWSFVIAVCR